MTSLMSSRLNPNILHRPFGGKKDGRVAGQLEAAEGLQRLDMLAVLMTEKALALAFRAVLGQMHVVLLLGAGKAEGFGGYLGMRLERPDVVRVSIDEEDAAKGRGLGRGTWCG
jgi:hypothetical protein